MIDQGLLQRPRFGDLRDLVARRAEEGSVVSVAPDDTLLTAFQRMRLADVSQLPVLDDEPARRPDRRVRPAARRARRRRALPRAGRERDDRCAVDDRADASLAELEAVLGRGHVAIVADARGFHGLITRFDLLNHLRRTLAS